MSAIEEQKAMHSEEIQSPLGAAGEDVSGKKQGFFVSKRSLNLGENKNNALMLIGALGVTGVVGIFMLSHTDKPGAKPVQPATQVNAVKPVQNSSAGYIPGDKASASTDTGAAPAISAVDVENTKNKAGDMSGRATTSASSGQSTPAYGNTGASTGGGTRTKQTVGSTNGSGQNLGTVPAFQAPVYQQGTSVTNSGFTGSGSSSTEQARAYTEAVTKPSLVFAAQGNTPSQGGASSSSSNKAEPITNFGLEPGFHVSAHLEASVSTVGGAPAVAVVEYDCMKNGKVVIPAGSRVVGKVIGASSTGLVNLSFSEIYLPNGMRTPISAVGLDQYLHQIKGNVTGKNTGKQFAIASLTSVGSLGAGFFGNNNSGSITQADLARMQVASNIGNAGDQVIQRMQVSQSLVVTVPSGTLVYVTFLASVRGSVEQAAETQQTAR